MITPTERKHWVNDHQVRGGWFHSLTFTFPLTPYAGMLSWGWTRGLRTLDLKFYQLID